MAVYRNIHVSFWTDPKVDDNFTPEDKYFFLYLLTNPHANMAGCYEVSVKQITRETGYTAETVNKELARMQNEHNVIRYDPETKEILLLNWPKYNWTSSAKVTAAVSNDISRIKNADFKQYLSERLNNRDQKIPYPHPTDTLSIPYPNPIHTSCSVVFDSDVFDSDVSSRPESREELLTFCREHGISLDFGNTLFDQYSANGWRDDKGKPVRVWKNLLLRAWEREKKRPAPNNPEDPLQAIRERRQRERENTITTEDVDEWPPGSGEFLPIAEIEKRKKAGEHGHSKH